MEKYQIVTLEDLHWFIWVRIPTELYIATAKRQRKSVTHSFWAFFVNPLYFWLPLPSVNCIYQLP